MWIHPVRTHRRKLRHVFYPINSATYLNQHGRIRERVCAHSKYTLGEVNTEFAYAFEQAKQLGRYHPRVQFELANNGIRA